MVSSRNPSDTSLPLILDIDDFKGNFCSTHCSGEFRKEDADAMEGNPDWLPNIHGHGHARASSDAVGHTQDPLFPEVDSLLGLFKDSCKELVDLRQQINGRFQNMKKDVAVQDSKHWKTLTMSLVVRASLMESIESLNAQVGYKIKKAHFQRH